MKALSIKQPWAWLIVNGYKDVENRSWRTKHRGPFLIHASKKIDLPAYKHYKIMIPELPDRKDLELGGIVGRARLAGVTRDHDSPWFDGPVGFVLDSFKVLPFMPRKGTLGFFEVDYE